MRKLDPDPFIEESEDKIVRPAICVETGEKIELSSRDLVFLNENHRPISRDCEVTPTYVSPVQPGGGYFNNGIHPETGETEAIGHGEWWVLTDKVRFDEFNS